MPLIWLPPLVSIVDYIELIRFQRHLTPCTSWLRVQSACGNERSSFIIPYKSGPVCTYVQRNASKFCHTGGYSNPLLSNVLARPKDHALLTPYFVSHTGDPYTVLFVVLVVVATIIVIYYHSIIVIGYRFLIVFLSLLVLLLFFCSLFLFQH